MNLSDDRNRSEPPSTVAELVDGAVRRISTSIAIAGALIGLAIYARPGPPRYDAFATEKGIVRIDTRSGKVIGCEGGRCMTLLQRGQRLASNPNRIGDDDEAPPPEPRQVSPQPTQKALPSPAAAPAKAPEPQSAPATAPAPRGQ